MTAPRTYTVDAAIARNVVQGDRNEVHFGADNRGMIVQLVAAPATPPRPVTPPVWVRPPRMDGLVGRDEQVRDVLRELRRSQVVQVVGPSGIGKTALLRHLCWHAETARPAEGIVFKEQRAEPLEDLLQYLFECFYDTESPMKLVGGRLRRCLQDVAAVIVIDDSRLDRDDLETLRNHLPRCPLLAAGDGPRWLDESVVLLSGLSPSAGRALFERTLGRSLTPDEEPGAETLIAALAGVPGHIRQAAHLVTRGAPRHYRGWRSRSARRAPRISQGCASPRSPSPNASSRAPWRPWRTRRCPSAGNQPSSNPWRTRPWRRRTARATHWQATSPTSSAGRWTRQRWSALSCAVGTLPPPTHRLLPRMSSWRPARLGSPPWPAGGRRRLS